jgi:hypothetical protein
MSFESLMTELRPLNSSVEALAALGAELRLRREGLGGDPRVRSLLQDVVHKIDPELFAGLDPNQELAALERVYKALAPGGWLVFGLYPPSPDALGKALTNLRVVRGGGYPWTTSQAEERLRTLGFERIETFTPLPPVSFVLGQRPNIPE